jgi:hypothetical protein
VRAVPSDPSHGSWAGLIVSWEPISTRACCRGAGWARQVLIQGPSRVPDSVRLNCGSRSSVGFASSRYVTTCQRLTASTKPTDRHLQSIDPLPFGCRNMLKAMVLAQGA